ncbi:hypothetical protein OMAG_001845 [Candidatus Omnitrophus magneticus]|uniref:Uncharacterized protein n=1 Tax=Candidatus Omnitrophus magneticus TaxID=1609969 RepID=A0A0F0CMA9_9BACT|nr:hypothetical protein OMAG_001845 [Candidatus Omnitrophus magneticus]
MPTIVSLIFRVTKVFIERDDAPFDVKIIIYRRYFCYKNLLYFFWSRLFI